MSSSEMERVRRGLVAFAKKQGWTFNYWANQAGISEGTLRAFVDGPGQSMTLRTLMRLAHDAGRTVSEIIGEKPRVPELPLWGYVGAGEKVYRFDGDESGSVDLVDAPPLEDGMALIVRGESMLPLLQPGDVIFVEMHDAPPATLLNEECVVRLADATVLVKRITRGTRRNRFHLVSLNPAVPVIEDQPVAAASPIRWIKRRLSARS